MNTEQQLLPPLLEEALRGEARDFVVHATRQRPLSAQMAVLTFSVIWLMFMTVFMIAMFGPLLHGGEVHFNSNSGPMVASLTNWQPLLVPGIIIGLMTIIGIVLLIVGIVQILAPGGWFVGTPKALVLFGKNKFRATDWEQFTGDLQVSGNEQKGNLTLVMRTGEMVRSKNRSHFVPDKIYIVGVPGIFQIERICRQRIKENDPTPTMVS